MVGDPAGEVGRDREADSLVAATVGGDGGVDADDFALEVDQRAARVAGIDRGVGLEELSPADATEFAALPADDAGADGGLQIERIADRDHPVADLELVGVAKLRGGQVLGVGEFDDREIALGVGLDRGGLELATVGEFHRDLIGPLDDMVVGDHHARGVDDHTRAHAGTAGHLAPFRHVELEALGKTFGKHALKRRALQWIVASASLGAAAGRLFRLRLAANDDDRRGGGLSRPTEGLGEGVGMDEVVGGRLGTHGDGR